MVRGREMVVGRTYCRNVSMVSSRWGYLVSFRSNTSLQQRLKDTGFGGYQMLCIGGFLPEMA
jgi:hypothetical protein